MIVQECQNENSLPKNSSQPMAAHNAVVVAVQAGAVQAGAVAVRIATATANQA